MKIVVTGGTGFVGCHSVNALADAGHELRLLVRSETRIAPALAPLGVDVSDVVVGDITDPVVIRRALSGCDAVLHAANVFSFDPRDARQLRRTNVGGTEQVLHTAHELALDPIVHVSSVAALLPAAGPLGPDSPIGRPRGPYAQSKAEAERVARGLQDEGAPVVITHPGAVMGPHDPHLGENAVLLRNILRGNAPVAPRGRMPIVDVRDVAAVHTAVMTPGLGPRRYLAIGEVVTFDQVLAVLRAVTGRRLPAASLPTPLLLGVARVAELAQQVMPFRLPVGFQAPWLVANSPPADAAATARDLGLSLRPAADAIADTVRWLHAASHIDDHQAGSLLVAQNTATNEPATAARPPVADRRRAPTSNLT